LESQIFRFGSHKNKELTPKSEDLGLQRLVIPKFKDETKKVWFGFVTKKKEISKNEKQTN